MQRFGWICGAVTIALLGCSGEEPGAQEPQPAAEASELAREGVVLRHVESWGPQSTQAGTPFNRQPSGDSAFWIVSRGEPGVVVELAGEPLLTTVADDIVTAVVPAGLVGTLLAQPGTYELTLESAADGRRQAVGKFRVE